MPTFTVHQPPPRKGEIPGEATVRPERFVFVRDGFYFWAFLLTPVWLAMHRLWLVLFGYVVAIAALAVTLNLIGAAAPVKYAVAFLIALMIGFEASSLWRWTLTRRKWKTLGFVVAEDSEMAERRFFAAWANEPHARAAAPAAAVVPPTPIYTAPMRRGAPSASDVIGLFPEPGGQR